MGWGGGHRSWHCGRGGVDQGAVLGEGVREGLAWRGKEGVRVGGARARVGSKGGGKW